MKLLLALVGVALAIQSVPFGRAFSSNKEYIFRYDSQLLSGIPLSDSQTSNTRLSCDVVLQMTSDRIGLLRMKNIQVFAGHAIPSSLEELRTEETMEKRELSREHEKMLQLPIRFEYRHGLISNLEFSSDDEAWSNNIKRAIVNLLQLNLRKENREDTKLVEYEDEIVSDKKKLNDYFTATEKTIEGECQVSYTVLSDESEEKTTVTKTVNFDKCSKRSDIRYNLRFLSECPECMDKKNVVAQTVYNYKLEKEQLKEVIVRSVYSVQMLEETVMKTETNSRLVLRETKEIRDEMEVNTDGEKEDLIYSNKWEELVERFFKNGDDSRINPFEKMEDKETVVEKIIKDLVRSKEHDPETVHLMARLVRIFRMSSVSDLKKIHKIYKHSDDKKVRDIISHSYAIAGTKNTIEHLISHIVDETISVEKAALLLKSVQETPYPSEKIADLIREFTETEVVLRSPLLKQSAWLVYGSIVRGIVVPTAERHMINEQTITLKNKFMTILHKQLKKADTVYEKVLAIKTIANSGLDIAVQHLERVIYDKQEQKVVRMEAVDALRHLTEQMPRKIQRLLMPIYSSRQHPVELRMASLVKILDCKPEASLLSQIVNRMERETNEQVATFTYYMLTTLAKSESPVHKRVASDISTLLRQTRYQPEKRLLSHYIHFPLFSENIFSGVNFNMATLFGKNSPFPTEVMASLETVFGKNWSKYLGQMGFTQQNLEEIVYKLQKKLNKMEVSQKLRAQRVEPALELIKEISRKLNIKARNVEKEEPYTMVYFRFKNMDFAVIPLDEKIMDKVLEKYITEERSLYKSLLEFLPEFHFDYTMASFISEVTYKFPTTSGLPLTVTAKIPTVASAKGKIQFEKVNYGLRLRVKAEPTVAATHVYEMRFWSPIFEQGVKTLHSVHSNTPVDIETDVIMNTKIEVVLKSLIPQTEKTLIRVSSRPVAYIRMMSKHNKNKYVEAEEKTISLPRWEQLSREFDKTYPVSGVKFVVRGNQLVEKNLKNMLLGEQQLEILYVPTSRVPKDLKIRWTLDYITRGNIDMPQMDMLLEEELETEDYEYDRRDEKSRREEGQKMIRELDEKQGYKQRMSFSVEVESEKKAEMEVRYEWLNDLRFARFVVEAKRNALEYENREWTLKTNVEMLLPKEPKTLKELKEQKHREIQINFESRWGSEKKNTLNMKVQLEQSKEHRRWIRLAEKELRGMSSYELLVKAARLNQVKIVTKYDLTPASEMVLSRVYDLIKSYSLFSHSVERKMDSENTRRALTTFTIDSYTQRLFNLTIETPREILRLENVVIPSYWIRLPTIARVPSSDKIFTPRAECQIKSNKMITFDDVIYRAPLTTCYSVVAKDCSESPKFIVKVKKVSENSEKKIIRVVEQDNEFVVELEDEKMKVTMNKKVLRKSDYSRHNIELLGEKMIVLDLESVAVKFDGYTVKVNVHENFKNIQCGLCGHYDGERYNDFRTAEDEETTDIEKFHRSFLVNDKECNIEEDRLSDKKNYKIEESDEEMYEDESDYYTEERRDSKKERKSDDYSGDYEMENSTPIKKTRVIELSHRVCFSMEPVEECPKKMLNTKVEEKKIRFTCLPRHEPEARRMLSESRKTVLELTDMPVTFVENLLIPRFCQVY